jgi:hypothetical protein
MNISNTDISPIKILSILYVLLMSNILFTKINKHLIEYIQSNVLAKHILGFITIIVLITLVYKNIDYRELLFYSIITYILFILSTKCIYQVNIIILGLLFILYIYNYFTNDKIKNLNTSQINITDKNKLISKLKINKNHGLLLFAGAVIIGSLLYDSKKYEQYKNNYSLLVFVS